ncbi:hypothetical protein VaNZ11_006907 [Volvox africanus]|uniref:Right handed beta helix domain-containing protein n=1 Tax=Volvox africanus TaxID=51714 RepID=A0ABQ5S1N0_9CHLO|nr:hypothetical protein VaNZ11_006907 [Volvox africanus]
MPIKFKVKPTLSTKKLIIHLGEFNVNPCTMGWRQDRLLQSFWIVVLLSGVLQWSSSVYAAESILPGATVVCSITLTGEPKSTTSINTGAWMPAFFRIQCNSTGHSQTRVTIGLGEQLMRYAPPADGKCGSPPSSPTSNAGSPPPYPVFPLSPSYSDAPSYPPSYVGAPVPPPSYRWATPSPIYLSGTAATLPSVSRTGAGGGAWRETHSTVSLPASEGSTDSFDALSPTSPISPPLIPPSVTPPPFPLMVGAECFVESWDDKDWGITFTDQIEHLELRDSVIQGAPLSYQPLIRCPNCKYVTLVNVTVRDLQGKNLSIDDDCEGRTVGALYFGGVRGAIVDQLTCVNVKGATDFACLWFGLTSTDVDSGNEALSEAAFFRISNSAFMNNSITKGDCIEDDGSEGFGFGCVVFYAIDADALLGSVEVFGTTMYDIEGGFGSAVSFVTRDGNLLHMDVFNISGSNFTHNKAAKHGGAVFINVRTSLDLLHVTQSSRIDNNTAGSFGNGGAFYIGPLIESLVVEGTSSVSANSADLSGGAFYFEKGITNISILRGSNVSGNRAFENGGAFCIRDADVNSISVEDNSHVDHNTVDVDVGLVSNGGGAFYLQDVSLKQFVLLNGSSMDNNMLIGTAATRRPGSGGALRVDGDLDTLVVRQNSSISNNTAGAGGGVFIARGIPGGIQVLEGSRIDNNSATGGDVDVQKPDGGGIMVTLDCPNVTVMDWSSISGNIASHMAARGGGVFIGGGLQKLVVKKGSKMSRNFATQGGAAIGVGLSPDLPIGDGAYMVTDLVEVSDESCICNNSASASNIGSYSGAMYFGKTRVNSFTITNGSCVCGNKVAFGDGYGGAVYADNGFVNFTVCHNSGLSENMGGSGGAVYFPDQIGQPFLSLERFELCDNSHMDGNQARTSGGALYMAGTVGQIIFSNSTISHNRAMITGGALALRSMFQSFSIGDALVYNNSVKFAQGGFLSLEMAPDDITTTSKSEVDDPTAADLSKYHLPSNGPFYFNIIRTNISGNSAMKDGGAIAFDLRIMMSNIYNDTLRTQLQKGQVLYIFITDTSWNDNWAHYGAGGALAFLSITPFIADEQRLASVLLGARINIKNSTFTTNTAGDNMKRFLSVKDISPLRGNGGALFIWAEPFPFSNVDAGTLSSNQSAYVMYDDASNCVTTDMDDSQNLSCWPRGSQSCGIRLEGVTLTGNLATGGYGGGLLVTHCAAKIINSTFYNNSATLDGGGLAFMDYALSAYLDMILHQSIRDSRMPPNATTVLPLPTPSLAGGLRDNYVLSSSPGMITSGDIFVLPWLDNTSSVQPSVEALQNIDTSKPLQQPWLVLTHTSFEGNMATNGGAAFLEVNATAAVIIDCDLMRNQAQVQGGGIMLVCASSFGQFAAIVRGTNFMHNDAGTAGGGLSARLTRTWAVAVLLNGTFEENSATRGGGIFNSGVKGSSFLLWSCTLQRNTANFGGGIALDYLLLSGTSTASVVTPSKNNVSGLLPPSPRPPSPPPAPPRPPPPPAPPPPVNGIAAFNPSHARVHLLNCNLRDNQGILNGGAVYMTADKQNVLALLEQSKFGLNRAILGGGFYVSLTRACVMRVSNCSVLDNTAQLEGGGAYSTTKCGGQLLVGNGSVWSGNSAGSYGGAIMVVNADDITFSNNTANVSLPGTMEPQPCSLVSLNVSDSSITGNNAQDGGGIYAYNETSILVLGSTLANNTVSRSGGAIAVVNCNLLNLFNCSIANNIAAFAGGGIFNDKCAIFVMTLGDFIQNRASTGGGIHIVGNTVPAIDSGVINDALGQRRSMQSSGEVGTYTSGNATGGTVDNSVAILSLVDFDRNMASADFGQLIIKDGAASSETPSPSSSPSTATAASSNLQSYPGHGGAIFISGHVGVAVSNSTAGPGNYANVGTVLATTQACAWATLNATRVSDTTDKTAVEKVAMIVATDLVQEVRTLSRSAREQCSLLMLSETKLLSATTPQQNSSSKLPLIWMRDLNASALLVNCAATGSRSINGDLINKTQQEYLQHVPPPAPNPAAETNNGGNANLPPFLKRMLSTCGNSSGQHGAAMALAVPATHMRLISFGGVLLVPTKGVQVLRSAGYSTFDAEDIKALVVKPNTFFDLGVQLYDGLDQPVFVDTPTFSVSLSIHPDSTDAILRSEGISLKIVTINGEASWTALEILGWPGKYVLEVTAVIDESSVNSTLPEISPLKIGVELLPCEVGSELVKGDGNGYSCSACRRDRVGLWTDRRPPLSKLPSHGNNLTNLMNSMYVDLTIGAADGDEESSCPSCCQACPTNAICPGGALLLPAPGYWHSAPNSPRMHRCPQPAACGKVESFGDALDGFWDKALLRFNLSSNGLGPLPTVTFNSTIIAVDNLSVIALRKDNRSLLLTVCQLWSYETFPPNRDNVLQQQYKIPRLTMEEELPCVLFKDDPSTSSTRPQGSSGNRSYLQLQCATGYTGHLCAACLPGYSLSVDFSCMKCPSLARTIVVGLLAFWGTVALILFTTFSNMSLTRSETMEAEEFSSLDLLKTLITHVQYFIIITKLGIDYPPIITKYQSVLSSFTGSENFIAYSPSCLFNDLASASQAATQIAFGFAAPCTAVVVSFVIWGFRYVMANQSKFRRINASRFRGSPRLTHEIPISMEPSQQLSKSGSKEGPFQITRDSDLPSKANKTAGKGHPAATAATTTHGIRRLVPSTAEPMLPSVNSSPSTVAREYKQSDPRVIAERQQNILSQGHSTEPGTSCRPDPASATTSSTSPSSGPPLLCGVQAESEVAIALAPPGVDATVATAASPPPANTAPVSPLATRRTFNSSLRSGNNHALLDRQTAVPSGPGSPPSGGNGIQHNGVMGAPCLPHSASLPHEPDCAAGYPIPPPAAAGNKPMSREEHWKPTPFSLTTFGPEDGFDSDILAQAEENKDRDQEHENACSFIVRAVQRYANPLHLLLFADQSVSMLQQLGVVLIVASFILYPSLCQISLSIFSCYKLDPGTGVFKENQQATWSHGYWVRNMQQECYAGVHKRVYVPIGIATVLLFCFCPPITYLILTTRCRRKPNDTRMRIQYGFLYQQYKPEFFWWASMRQLQVLALVAVEVFGRGLPVQQQALMLLSVLIVIAAINTSSSPERFHELLILEFLSMCVLSLTLTLGLYFIADGEDQLSATASTAVGAVILTINACFILGVLTLFVRGSADRARQVHRILSTSWNSVVTSVSRAIVHIEQRYSMASTPGIVTARSSQRSATAGRVGSASSGGNRR